MDAEQPDLKKYAQVLFTHFYDDETGAFKRSVDSVNPDPFSTIEALYSLLHSPAKSQFQHQITNSLQYLVNKHEKWDGKTRPYTGAERPALDYSTLSISFSLIVFARGRKFIQSHNLSSQLKSRITDIIQRQLQLLIRAKQDDGWSYVPSEGVDDGGYEFKSNVYCTAIALQALINCRSSDFPSKVSSNGVGHEGVIVDATRDLLNLSGVPDTDILNHNGGMPKDIDGVVFEEAVLMTHWMHVLSHVLYDTDRWAEDTTQPSKLTDVNQMLRESSELISILIQNPEKYPKETKFGFADIRYDLELEYPKKTSEETIEKDTFKFSLPGSTALPALVLNPNVSFWSKANQEIYDNVTKQFEERHEDLRNYGIGDGKDWPIHCLSAPLVGISYMQSVNEGVKSLIKYFIQEGEVPEVGQAGQELRQFSESKFGETEITNEQTETNDGAAENSENQDNIRSAENSTLVGAAVILDRWIGRFIKRIKGWYERIAAYSGKILLLILILSLGAYVYSVELGQSETQILITASLSGLIASLTVYDFLTKWNVPRPASAFVGLAAVIVIVMSSSVFTSIPNDMIVLGAALISVLSLITNTIVSSQSG